MLTFKRSFNLILSPFYALVPLVTFPKHHQLPLAAHGSLLQDPFAKHCLKLNQSMRQKDWGSLINKPSKTKNLQLG